MTALRIADFSARDALDHTEVVDALIASQIDVALVRGVLAPEACARASELIACDARFAGAPIFPERSPNRAMRMLGTMIAPTELAPRGPELDDYRAAVQPFSELCDVLFGTAPSFSERIARVLSALATERPASVPCFDDGAPFAAATLRCMPVGTGAPAHRDNNPAGAAYTALRAVCDLDPQLSYYVPLSVPERGGELRVGTPLLANGSELLKPGVGDLILFAGSRFEHEVVRVEQEPVRRTIGGFCALSRDHSTLRFWS